MQDEPTQNPRAEAILAFWFGTPFDGKPRAKWFEKEKSFDAELSRLFMTDYEAAAAGDYDHWAADPRGALALLILLDQFPRNLFRGTPRAFATDEKALQIARSAVAQQHDKAMLPVERWFVYLPFEHSEEKGDQRRAMSLFETLSEHEPSREAIDFARRHFSVIARFGRFPHRNAVLGRKSTPEEIDFLKQPGSSF